MAATASVHMWGAHAEHDMDRFHDQAVLLLTEATEAAKDVTARLATGQALAENDEATTNSARSLVHLLQQILEFGVKDEWIHISHPSRPPFPREASYLARCIASNRGPPTALQMLQALEHRWRGAACPADVLPTSAVPATAANTIPPGRALRAYMHAVFNARATAALLAALHDARPTVLQDWQYAWSALQRDDASTLLAELERLDAVNRGALALPVEQPPADAGGPHIPVGQRVQGFMAKARTVATGVIQHTSAQATAFTQQLRSGGRPATADAAVELEDSSWCPPARLDDMHAADAGDPGPGAAPLNGTIRDSAFAGGLPPALADAGALLAADSASDYAVPLRLEEPEGDQVAPDLAGDAMGSFTAAAPPIRTNSPVLASANGSPTWAHTAHSALQRPQSSIDLGGSMDRQLSQRRSVDGTHMPAGVGSGPPTPEPARAAHAADGAAAGSVASGGAEVDINVLPAEVVTDTSGRQHGEFRIATTAGGREFRVARRFRQVRTLQQQLRGCYRGGNLDLFLPAAGEQELPPSWAEITKAATAVGSNRTTPATLASRRALLQRCFQDLLTQRPQLLLHAATLEFLGLARSDVPPAFLRPPSRASAASPPPPQVDRAGGAAAAAPAASRHLKMNLDVAHDMQLSEQEVAREQRGMCRGCGRTLGGAVEEPEAAAADGPTPLRRLSSLRRSMTWLLPEPEVAERPRRCHYDGGLYCVDCHSGQTAVIPARVVGAWDFRKVPVCDDAREFLLATRAQPLIRIDADEQPEVFARAPLLRETMRARRRIAQLLGTLTVAEDVGARDAALRLRFAAGQRVHLLEGDTLWSMVDLEDLARGAAFAQQPAWLAKVEEKLRSVHAQRGTA
eukprot:jgi/Ulvmu1/10270/UM060_0072.1